ncbi:MAG: hypothetical protein MJZ16_07015 [Bacteroidales bacterium]|nr:hypothetical protein [Bacteroidales bacterium]
MNRILLLSLCLLIGSAAVLSAGSKKEAPAVEPQYASVVLKSVLVPSKYLSGDDGRINVYLPADWATTNKKYPVLYLLHGMQGNNTDWTKNASIQKVTDEAINAGKTGAFIIVMPKAYNSFYVNGMEGTDKVPHDYESFFWEELVPFVEKTFPVLTDKQSTAISGLSMGGFGCNYYAFTRPEKFCFCYSMSGALEGRNNSLVPSVKDIFIKNGYDKSNFNTLPTYVMDCGSEDPLCFKANESTHAFLESIGFEHTYTVKPGVHNWPYWIGCYSRLLDMIGTYFPAK